MNNTIQNYTLRPADLRPLHPPAKKGHLSMEESTKLKEACRDFESLFIKQMLDSMRKTVQKSGFNDGGMAEEIFQDMMFDEYAKKLSRSAGFGISDQLYRELSGTRYSPRQLG